MKSRNFAEHCKNAMGTVFLLAGAFFVCSTLISMRAVFADPIAPINTSAANNVQSPRSNSNVRASARPTSSRSTSSSVVSRGTTAANNAATVSRGVTSRTTTVMPSTSTVSNAGRSTVSSARSSATSNASNTTASRGVSSRNVVSRTTSSNVVNSSRNVVSRAATNSQARISLQGSAIRGSKSAATNTYTYLQSKLYTGNYSNIIDSSTGLISPEAYNN